MNWYLVITLKFFNMDYNKQIKHLTDHPDYIYENWSASLGLFKMAGEKSPHSSSNLIVGCLTMIRSEPDRFGVFIKGELDVELSKALVEDERIPTSVDSIKVEHLP